jgi:hypothetical protein
LLTVLPVPGEFRLQWSGPPGMTHRVLRSTNLVGWMQVLTTNSPALPFAWSDPLWLTRPAGFYRVEIIP